MCVKFQQKLSNSLIVEACESFQFFRQNTWFLKNNKALSQFSYGILHYLIRITKLLKKLVHISQFYINHSSHLHAWLVSDQGPLALELRTLPLSYVELWSEHLLSTSIFLIAAENNLISTDISDLLVLEVVSLSSLSFI